MKEVETDVREHSRKPPRRWSEVWKLYRDHQSVFATVIRSLRSRGMHLGGDEAQDLVHEFLLERASSALATFNPARGSMRPWLSVVFRRFVLGKLRTQRRQTQLLADFSVAAPDSLETTPDLELDAAAEAVDRLPREERRAVRAFFGADGGSVRAVSRTLRVTRWRATTLLAKALAQISSDMGVEVETIDRRATSEDLGRLRKTLLALLETRAAQGE